MAWITVFALAAAWLPAKTLAQKWGRGVLVFVAAVIGVVSSFVVTITLAWVFLALYPNLFGAGELLIKALSWASVSFIVSPIAALAGWRKAKNPSPPKLPTPPRPGAFDNLKRK